MVLHMATILLLVTNLFDVTSQAAQTIQLNRNLLVLIPSKTRVISCNTDGLLMVHIIKTHGSESQPRKVEYRSTSIQKIKKDDYRKDICT